MSIYIRMPTINFSVTQSIETLAVNLSASEALVMNINNPLIGASYFGLETIPDSNGVYTSAAPKNTSGSFTLGTGILGVVRDDYKMSAVVSPGNNVLTFSPAVAVTGSTLRTRGIGAPPLSTGIDADAQAFFDRVTAAGGTLSATEQTAVNTLVVTMKADGTWTPMKAIYPMVGASAAACAQNLKSASFTGTFSSGWTFASTGVTPNGSSAFFDTKLNAAANLTFENNHMSAYVYNDIIGSYDMGCSADNSSIVDELALLTRHVSNQIYYSSDGTYNCSVSIANSQGHTLGTMSGTNTQNIYKNGINLRAVASGGSQLASQNIYIGAIKLLLGPGFYSNHTYSLNSIGDALTNTQVANFYTAVQAFQTTLSRQV
jgi:hypothetical protein